MLLWLVVVAGSVFSDFFLKNSQIIFFTFLIPTLLFYAFHTTAAYTLCLPSLTFLPRYFTAGYLIQNLALVCVAIFTENSAPPNWTQ